MGEIKYFSKSTKKQINTAPYWDMKGINVPSPDEFLMNSQLIKWIASLVSFIDKPKIVDLGGSEGSLLEAVNRTLPGCDLTCVDFSSRAISIGKDSYPDIKFVKDNIVEYAKNMEPVDVIIINHTLEHFEDPQEFVDLMLTKCKYLAIGVPYKFAYDNPEHLVYFDENSFEDYTIISQVIIDNHSLELILKGGIEDEL